MLGLGDRHPVAWDDDDLLGLFEHIGGVFGAALLVGPLFARRAAARFGRCAKAAGDHRNEAAVHRAAHDVAEDRARGADQRAGDDHRRIAEREAHRRRGPARIAVQHRHHDGHVRAADRDDQQEADDEGQHRDGKDHPALTRAAIRRDCVKRDQPKDRGKRAQVDDVPPRQHDRRTAHPARQLEEGDNAPREGDRPDGDAKPEFDAADREDLPCGIDDPEGLRIEPCAKAHHHCGKADEAVEARDKFGHRGHRDTAGDDHTDHPADGQRNADLDEIGEVVGDQRRDERDPHPDHAVAVAAARRRGARQSPQCEDEEHTAREVGEHRPGGRAA